MRITSKHELTNSTTAAQIQKIIEVLLKNRNIDDIETFLHPPHPEKTSIFDFDTSYKKSIKSVFKILEKAKADKKTVVVYTDYDADGITAGAILWETLHKLGFAAMPYVPHRVREGYGFSKKGIDAIKKEHDPALIISVDHGIAAKEQIEYAAELGIPIVVTDHHLAPKQLPDKALAIFHIPLLSGSGVSYFFSKAIFEHFEQTVDEQTQRTLRANFEGDYLALAATGTIADLVPLTGVSRGIALHGLHALTTTKRAGFIALKKQASIEHKPITPYEVGFMIAPRINAVGRLEHALDALRLLCTTSPKRAGELASQIEGHNVRRQSMVQSALKQALKQVEALPDPLPKVLVLTSTDWHEGILGLIAARLCEKYYRPTIIMTRSNEFYKASARSIPSFHITDFLRGHADHLVGVGGHAQAAGFTIEADKCDGFMKALQKSADEALSEDELKRVIEVDIAMPAKLSTVELALAIADLAPFGMGNPAPMFTSNIEVASARTMGATNKHLKIISADGLEIVAFGKGDMHDQMIAGSAWSVVYSIEINQWNNTTRVQAKAKWILTKEQEDAS